MTPPTRPEAISNEQLRLQTEAGPLRGRLESARALRNASDLAEVEATYEADHQAYNRGIIKHAPKAIDQFGNPARPTWSVFDDETSANAPNHLNADEEENSDVNFDNAINSTLNASEDSEEDKILLIHSSDTFRRKTSEKGHNDLYTRFLADLRAAHSLGTIPSDATEFVSFTWEKGVSKLVISKAAHRPHFVKIINAIQLNIAGTLRNFKVWPAEEKEEEKEMEGLPVLFRIPRAAVPGHPTEEDLLSYLNAHVLELNGIAMEQWTFISAISSQTALRGPQNRR